MINESELLRSVGATIFARGKDYLSEGLIEDTTRKGQTLIAHVQGSRHKPYQVTINLDDKNDVEEADCTCPYGEEWDGWCKHIVAVLLYEIQEATAPEPAAAPKTKVKKVSGISHDAIQKEVRKQFKQLERNSRYGYRN
uniref:SWIM zinc finger family protein n=1 Tax=Armatimonas sp. TaxID=1872638 RepID=UPI0037502858